jgi:hypothetical protein
VSLLRPPGFAGQAGVRKQRIQGYHPNALGLRLEVRGGKLKDKD